MQTILVGRTVSEGKGLTKCSKHQVSNQLFRKENTVTLLTDTSWVFQNRVYSRVYTSHCSSTHFATIWLVSWIPAKNKKGIGPHKHSQGFLPMSDLRWNAEVGNSWTCSKPTQNWTSDLNHGLAQKVARAQTEKESRRGTSLLPLSGGSEITLLQPWCVSFAENVAFFF